MVDTVRNNIRLRPSVSHPNHTQDHLSQALFSVSISTPTDQRSYTRHQTITYITSNPLILLITPTPLPKPRLRNLKTTQTHHSPTEQTTPHLLLRPETPMAPRRHNTSQNGMWTVECLLCMWELWSWGRSSLFGGWRIGQGRCVGLGGDGNGLDLDV